MAEKEKNKVGFRYAVTAYVDPETFHRIEERRGDVTRSTYLGKQISKLMAV